MGSIKGLRDDNQDRAAVAFISQPSRGGLRVGLVCDGMGGMAQGAEAASCAAGAFLGGLVETSEKQLKNALRSAVMAANKEVYRRFGGGGGTTLTAIVLGDRSEAWVAHVGDSRLYGVAVDKLPRLVTRDDTIGGQLHSLDNGADDNLDNRLLQFVGIGEAIEPHVFPIQVRQDEKFVLTTDGAHSIGKKALDGILRNSTNSPEIVRKILYVAEAIGVEDNSSVVSIAVDEIDDIRNFSMGTELTVWSPSEKVELWLGPIDQLKMRRSESEAKKSSPPKQKKPPRGKAKQNRADSPLAESISGKDVKPQLFIEFGNKQDTEE